MSAFDVPRSCISKISAIGGFTLEPWAARGEHVIADELGVGVEVPAQTCAGPLEYQKNSDRTAVLINDHRESS